MVAKEYHAELSDWNQCGSSNRGVNFHHSMEVKKLFIWTPSSVADGKSTLVVHMVFFCSTVTVTEPLTVSLSISYLLL